MRRAAYVGASVAAAAAVVLRAFHERPNFYSATVYLGQSTACRMILLNMLLLTLGTSLYGLQRLLYGRLRAIEIEQLWDKAWYAITETALAMTTFRDEVGGYFFFMFMTLLAGKVWGWIGEGRVETLEQQPPANPKTFYARLTTSLVLSILFDLLMFRYCLQSILDQRHPRAGMMIMFVFEFAILAINSASTLSRYGLALYERWVVQKQTLAKVEERREEIRAERALAARRANGEAGTESRASSPSPNDPIEVDENEIDVPGWQEKGKFVLFLDLTTDFLKLIFYMTFFLILIVFAGIPIHMFRDLFITTRSFLKRINDYLKYRNATRDMNTRYPDATMEELQRDGTCIICREDMRPWQTPNVTERPEPNQDRPNRSPPDERQRPKKLPCGHILHFGCLRSWLERQQVCPTCRRSVLAPDPPRTAPGQAPARDGQLGNAGNGPGHGPQAQQHPPAPGQGPGQQQQPGNQANRGFVPGINRMRTFNLGGIRLTFATGQGVNVRDAMNQMHNHEHNHQGTAASAGSQSLALNGPQPGGISTELSNIERRLAQEFNSLNVAQQELNLVRAMQGELARLRMLQSNSNGSVGTPGHHHQYSTTTTTYYMPHMPAPQQQILSASPQAEILRSGDAGLPEGMTLPEGWSMLPLERMNARQPTRAQASGSVSSPSNVAQSQNPQQEQVPSFNTSSHQGDANVEEAGGDQHLITASNGPRSDVALRQQRPSETQPIEPETSHEHASRQLQSQPAEEPSTEKESVPKPQSLEQDPSPAESTRQDRDEPDVPQWSSDRTNGSASSMNGHSQIDKGKGRAAQVEDAPDEER